MSWSLTFTITAENWLPKRWVLKKISSCIADCLLGCTADMRSIRYHQMGRHQFDFFFPGTKYYTTTLYWYRVPIQGQRSLFTTLKVSIDCMEVSWISFMYLVWRKDCCSGLSTDNSKASFFLVFFFYSSRIKLQIADRATGSNTQEQHRESGQLKHHRAETQLYIVSEPNN